MSAIQPLLSQQEVRGIFWYTFGAGYSGWHGTEWSPSTANDAQGTGRWQYGP
jgi:hypothetical protein